MGDPIEVDAAGMKRADDILRWMEKYGLKVGLLAIFLIFALVVAGGSTLLYFYNQAMRSTPLYQEVLHAIQKEAAVQVRLGEEIRDGWLVSGSIRYRGEEGDADYSFTVRGSKNLGRINTRATRKGGSWTIDSLHLVVGGEDVDLGKFPLSERSLPQP